MRIAILLLTTIVIFMFAFRFKEKQTADFNITAYKSKNIISCNPDWAQVQQLIEATDIPPLPGAGKHQWKITTSSDSAQFYFNQGINCYYGFHIIEAMASFKKALKFDADCAMLYWAQALSYGPNINDFGYRASPEALAATQKANELAGKATAFEKDLIAAINIRYTADSADATRAMLNQAYTAKMKAVALHYTTLADAQVLYADAMMLEHPWDLWNINGTPKTWTPAIETLLEQTLKLFPQHPGANHYYIHVMEASPFAAKALPSAEKLGITNPGLSHLVHMPSHIFLRAGRYKQGVDVNTKAVNSYRQSVPLYAPVAGADFLYVIHNLHMKTNNAMMLGNYTMAINAAQETQKNIPADYLSIPAPMGSYVQYINMSPVFVYIRFGKWNEILQIPKPAAQQVYANTLYHFARGMAFAATQKIDNAKLELKYLNETMKDSSLAVPFSPFAAAIEGATVAQNLLTGTIALKEQQLKNAITAFEKAVVTESNMLYNEPRDWMLSPAHFSGNALLLNNDGKTAEQIFTQDLKNNNENGWALYGLYKAMLLQNKKTAAAAVLKRYNRAFKNADVKLEAPVF